MTSYKDIDGDSGVSRYEIGNNRITVEFKTNSRYLYTYSSAGEVHIEKMKELAIIGNGLNSYINKNVRTKYDSNLI